MTNHSSNVLGLIAGGGRLPFLVAEGARRAGLKIVCVGLAGSAEPGLAHVVDVYYSVSVARPGSWIRQLRRHHVRSTIMVGRVTKTQLFTPRRILHFLPDWRAFRIFYWRMRGKTRQTDTLLCALADELETGGIFLENSTMYCKDHLAVKGVLSQQQPNTHMQADIEFGWTIAKKLGELDIGQAVTVKEKEIIAVEAIEGTAEVIKRTGRYCRSGGWILIKTSKPNQDMRFDVPCIGPDTIEDVANHGGKCIVIEAHKTIIIDKPETIQLADKLGIAIVAR